MNRGTLIALMERRFKTLYSGYAGKGKICKYTLKDLIEFYRVLAVHNALDQQ